MASQNEHFCCSFGAAGHVWLWRYTPTRQWAPAAGGGEAGAEEAAGRAGLGFTLVGCCKGTLAWVDALSWAHLPGPQGGCLALLAGSTDGGVTLWGSSVEHLAALPALPGTAGGQQQQQQGGGAAAAPAWLVQYGALERWATACAPDLRAVTSLAARMVPAGGGAGAGGGSQLLVAAGKAAGMLWTWQTAELVPPKGGSATDGTAFYKAALHASCPRPGGGGGGQATCARLHGLSPITGLSWAAAPAQPLPLLCSASLDGAIRCWQLPGAAAAGGGGGAGGAGGGSGGGLVELAAPQPCARRRKKEAGHGVFGLAASPNGLFVASVLPAFSRGFDFKKWVVGAVSGREAGQGVVRCVLASGPAPSQGARSGREAGGVGGQVICRCGATNHGH